MRGVVVADGRLEVVDDLEVREVRAGEVRIRVERSGLCRSDLLRLELPESEPQVLGHEAAGTVLDTGSGVTRVHVGDRVAVTTQRPCLRCAACARHRYSACPTSMVDPERPFTRRGQPVRSMARTSSLAAEIVVDELQAHRVDRLDLRSAALIGCAVSTGYGTVKHVAALAGGESVAVLGVGGVGINSIQAARLLGARRIVAVDVNPAKDETSRHFGADEFVVVCPGQPVEEMAPKLLAASGGAVDAVVETTGHPDMMSLSLEVLARGGRLALVGIPSEAAWSQASFDVREVMARHVSIVGAWNGACDPFVDLPEVVRLAERGDLELAMQVSHRFPIHRVAEAFETMQSGNALRVVIDMVD